ncbi:MAG: PhoPQ-activated pathogenicity [Candidatus Hydrogenedens sp.]|nr:PhoPQ-activated pathogenicity [Candidatus Hydrogenedens sp.]
MKRFILFILALVLSAPAAFAQYPYARETEHPTALDTYVATPDDHYSFEIVETEERTGWTSYVVKLISQQYLTEAEVDRPIWDHWMTICVPAEVKSDTAMLYISGGSNGKPAPKGAGGIIRAVATEAGCVTVELNMVPNEPLVFTDDNGRKRTEDAIIAYTWDKYMRTGDKKWPLRLPMTKSAVRAMDATQSILAGLDTPITVKDFVVAGGSKRGWTTWTTAVVDTRVKAIIPLVIDMLNVIPSFQHHYSVYGFWAPAVDDYVEMGIMNRMDTPEYADLMKIVEPYSYIDRLTMPKFVVCAGSDQFFLPDSSQFYYEDLKGVKRLRYIPNVGHGLGGDVLNSVTAFVAAMMTDEELPAYAWTFPDANTIRVTSETAPKAVNLWQVSNAEARDFRLETVGTTWEATELTADADGAYTGTVEEPEKGWRAYMIELTYDMPGESDIKFTTPIRVTPDETPFEYKPEPNPIPGFLTAK